jgi:hypothetical protein
MRATIRDRRSTLNVTLAQKQEGRVRAADPRAATRIKMSNPAIENLGRLIFATFPKDPGLREPDERSDGALGGRRIGWTGPCQL